MPGGTPHLVTRETSDVMHLGLGVHSPTWPDVLNKTLQRTAVLPNGLHRPADAALSDSSIADEALEQELLARFREALDGVDMQRVRPENPALSTSFTQ